MSTKAQNQAYPVSTGVASAGAHPGTISGARTFPSVASLNDSPGQPYSQAVPPDARSRGQECPDSGPVAASRCAPPEVTEILILSDGTLLIHNLTPAMAAALNQLNPQDPTIKPRVFEMNP